MLNLVHAEIAKLKGSLVLLLCAFAPLSLAGFGALLLLDREEPTQWGQYLAECLAMWAYFMLPMTVTALTVLVAQMEHGPRMWNHLLALPQPRWAIYLAKAIVVVGAMAVTCLILFVSLYAGANATEALLPGAQITGDPAYMHAAAVIGLTFAAAVAMIVVQLWAALRFASFVPPLVIGIGGTFVTLAVAASKQGIFLPWVLPVYVLGIETDNGKMALAAGLGGGALLAALMLIDMSRREHR